MKKSTLSSIALAALIGATAVMPATAQTASPSDSPSPDTTIGTQGINQCSEGYLCLWEHEDYGGSYTRIPRYPVGECVDVNVLDNMVSSIYNLSGAQIRVFTGKNCSGTGDDYFYQQKEPCLCSHWVIWPFETWNDQVSSLKWF